MGTKGGTQLLPRTSRLISLLTAKPNADLTFRAGLVLASGRCDHGAIGVCALCLGPCESCSAPNGDRKAVKLPVSQWRDYNDNLHCGLCGSDAGHLEQSAERDTGFYLDCIGQSRSVRFDRDGEL